ncbi:MAG: methyl-accepting chemotaxis protein [Leptospiraceae bacterium]|nr:methyl-accepting chemotaxis protein [Leptospiraceae bacterium]
MSEHKRPSPLKRKYLIDFKFQSKFIINAVIPLMLFVLVLAFGFMYAVNSIAKEYQFENTAELIQKLSMTLGNDATSGVVFQKVKLYGVLTLVALAVVMALSLTILFLLFSHRIAGPVLRIERTLEEILHGDLTHRISLRHGDELKETADHLNTMLDGLQARVKRIDQMARFMHESLEQMIKEAPPEKKEQLLKLDDLARGVKEAISDFKLQ